MMNQFEAWEQNQNQSRGHRSHTSRGIVVAILASLILVAGCATRDPSSVDRARIAVAESRDGGLVDSDSLDFREAERHLARAEERLEDGWKQELIDHEAEMAELYAEVAVARTEAIAAKAESQAYTNRARTDTAVTRVAVELAIRNSRAVDAKQTGRGLVLTLGGVLFDFNSADLKPEGRLSVARVAGFLIALDNRDAVIEGHADNTGNADYNVKLSLRRAESIRNALVEFGVSEDRMAAEGYGANFPVASNDTEEGREQNRRVEIVILRAGLSASDARR
jgi:outer membrane protein OmpA-like peptidoglycan-associated protein